MQPILSSLLWQKDVEVIHEDFYIVMWILYDNMEIVVVVLGNNWQMLVGMGQPRGWFKKQHFEATVGQQVFILWASP